MLSTKEKKGGQKLPQKTLNRASEEGTDTLIWSKKSQH